MEIELTEETLKSVKYITSHFAEYFANELTDITAVAYCLQILLDAETELEEVLKNEKS